MKLVLLALLLAPLAVQADLYRWVDPQTGSIKYSNYPPPWMSGEPETRQGPPVEVVPYRPLGTTQKQADNPNAFAISTLESRRSELARELASFPDRPPEQRTGAALKSRLEAYQALSAELDRLDPANVTRRRNENVALMQKLQKLFATAK